MVMIPSLFGEGTSVSALEAMACETATIGTRVGGLVDLPSFNVEPTVEALAWAMTEIFDRRGEIAQKQAMLVRGTFDLDRWRDAWLRSVHSENRIG